VSGTTLRLALTVRGPASVANAYTNDNTIDYPINGPHFSVRRVQFSDNATVIGDFSEFVDIDGGTYRVRNAALDGAAFAQAVLNAQNAGNLAISLSWRVQYLQFHLKLLEQMAFLADATHNFADPADPASILNTFTRKATRVKPSDTDWRIDLLDETANSVNIAVDLVRWDATTMTAGLRIALAATALTAPNQLATLQKIIAADWRALLAEAPDSSSTAPLTASVSRWQGNIRQYMLRFVPLQRGQELMDAATDAAESALGGALSDNTLNDTQRQQRVTRAARNEIDRFLITSNPWGQATNSGDYPEAIHTVLAMSYYQHWSAMPIAIIRSFTNLSQDQENRLVAQVGMGNCGEHSLVAFAVFKALMERNGSAKTLLRVAVRSGYANIDHCFVAGGEPPHAVLNVKIRNDDHPSHAKKNRRKYVWDTNQALENGPKTPGREGWLCDPYLAANEIAASFMELCANPERGRLREWITFSGITNTNPGGDIYPPPAVAYVPVQDPDDVNSANHLHVIAFCTEPGTLTAIAPTHGTAAGGTDVVVTGTHLEPRAALTIDGSAATSPTVDIGTQLKAKTPAHAAGLVGITVRNWKHASNVPKYDDIPLAYSFRYDSAPAITNLDVTNGPTTGGTFVTITGTNFANGAQVFVDNVEATDALGFATTLAFTTPPHVASGAFAVKVRNPDGQEIESAGAFTYDDAPAPVITGVNPISGSSLGGTDVTITGTNFVNGAKVKFGGVPAAAVDVQSATTIIARTAAHAAQQVAVEVANSDTKSVSSAGAFTYNQANAPTITGINPARGSSLGGTDITITGTNFVPGVATTKVLIGGVEATNVSVDSNTTIRARSAAHAAGQVSVEVRNPDTQSDISNGTFTVDAAAAPTVTAANPISGPASGGTNVTITGTGFLSPVRVFFGAVEAAAVRFVSATSVEATTAAGAGLVGVEVRNPDGQSGDRAGTFTFNAAPTFTAVNVNSGAAIGKTTVVITGTGFVDKPVVLFDANEARVTFDGATQLTVISPGHAAGAVAITIRNPDGQSVAANAAFTYNALPAPTITSLDLTSGPTWGRTAVVITGTNFTPATPGTEVLVDGASASNVRVIDATHVSFSTADHVAAQVTVSVKNPDGQRVDSPNAFTYQAAPAPTVTSVNPTSGTRAGGTTVTITGTNFAVDSRVKVFFGTAQAFNVKVVNNTTITVTTALAPAARVTVRVTNPDNQNGDRAAAFTYT
jgi:hypothetical protein